MNKITITRLDGVVVKEYLVPDSRLDILINYLKGIKQEEFGGMWGPQEQVLFADFSQVPKDGT